RRWSAGQKMFTAKNPAPGALLNYYLKDAVPPEPPKSTDADKSKPAEKKEERKEEKKEGHVKITVLDKDGKVVRELDGPGSAGVTGTNGDLRWTSPAEPTPEQLEAIAAGFDFGPRGPLVEPGEYTVKVKAGSQEATEKVTVEEDPRLNLSDGD